ncbi:BBSome-interacting protein 1 [Anastrepha ludens]|uniref:BBSome-interacting protein 1 n=1 Tax=Anastrepha ludens TaxID=28586 RepID=UPI0023B0A5D3|nr:BBSome-interacting protein 1 [Anastrepha ludens]
MSSEEIDILGKIDLIEPTTGKLFFEHKTELIFCKPHLIPLKTEALERLEEMQRQASRQLQEKRLKTATDVKNSRKAV